MLSGVIGGVAPGLILVTGGDSSRVRRQDMSTRSAVPWNAFLFLTAQPHSFSKIKCLPWVRRWPSKGCDGAGRVSGLPLLLSPTLPHPSEGPQGKARLWIHRSLRPAPICCGWPCASSKPSGPQVPFLEEVCCENWTRGSTLQAETRDLGVCVHVQSPICRGEIRCLFLPS